MLFTTEKSFNLDVSASILSVSLIDFISKHFISSLRSNEYLLKVQSIYLEIICKFYNFASLYCKHM